MRMKIKLEQYSTKMAKHFQMKIVLSENWQMPLAFTKGWECQQINVLKTVKYLYNPLEKHMVSWIWSK